MSKYSGTMKMVAGAVIGGIATLIMGFTSGAWIMSSKAEMMAESRASAAIVTVLTPMCLANFQKAGDATVQRTALRDAPEWKRKLLVEEAGWDKVFDESSPQSGLSAACAEAIIAKQ
jgi:hypothetical protein